AGLELVALAVGAHGVDASDFPIFDEFQRTGQRHVVELHPALEDVRCAEHHANRCGHDRRAAEHFIDDGPVTLDLGRTRLVQGKRPLLRDDRAQIPKRNEERAGASVAGGGGVVLRVAEGDAVEGWGEAAPNRFYGETPDTALAALARLAPIVERCDPWAIETVEAELNAALRFNGSVKSALSAALHDLAGKRLGVPLYKLWGLDASRAPLSSFTIAIAATDDELRRRIEQ